MAPTNDSRDKPVIRPGKARATPASPATAAPAGTSAQGSADDDEEPLRHPPIAPRDEDPLKSLGRSISEPVIGSIDRPKDKPKP
jgi:hypothetical protein